MSEQKPELTARQIHAGNPLQLTLMRRMHASGGHLLRSDLSHGDLIQAGKLIGKGVVAWDTSSVDEEPDKKNWRLKFT